jgi:hypothetical protein
MNNNITITTYFVPLTSCDMLYFEAETIDCGEVVTLVRRRRSKCLSLGLNSTANDSIVLPTDRERLVTFDGASRMILELFLSACGIQSVVLVLPLILIPEMEYYMHCINDYRLYLVIAVDHVPCYFLLLLLR